MQIIQPFQARILEDIEVGELLSTVIDGATIIAVKLMKLDGFMSALAVFKGYGDHVEPHILTITNDLRCVSYGSDWVFEVVQPDELVDANDVEEAAGLAYIGSAGTFLTLNRDPSNIRSTGGKLDLATLKFGNVGNPAFAATSWKIWASADDRDRDGPVPLTEHT